MRELSESRRLLEEHLGAPVDILAYPYGLYDQFMLEAVQEAGYKAAFGLNGGVNSALRSRLSLDRILVARGTSLAGFCKSIQVLPLGLDLGFGGDGHVMELEPGVEYAGLSFGISQEDFPCQDLELPPELSVQGQVRPLSLEQKGAWRNYSTVPTAEALPRGALIHRVSLTCGGKTFAYSWLSWSRPHAL
jgi:hypothetical protein